MIVLFGASGNTGRRLSRRLLNQGLAVTVVGREADKLTDLVAAGARPAIGDLTDGGFVRNTLTGSKAAYVLLPYDYQAPDLHAYQRAQVDSLIAGLAAAQVPRVVALSSYGAHHASGAGVMSGLHHLEQRLAELDHSAIQVLRAGFFFQNFLGMIPLAIEKGLLGGFPLRGDVPIPMVHTDDIADRAYAALTDRGWSGYRVEGVAGPGDVTLNEAASILATACGETWPWVQFPRADAIAGMQAMGMSASVAQAFAEMTDAANAGELWNQVDRPAADTTRQLDDFARTTFRSCWQERARREALGQEALS